MKEDYGEESEGMKRFNEKYGSTMSAVLFVLIIALWIYEWLK